MKKIYMKPETEKHELQLANFIAASLETTEEQASSGVDVLSNEEEDLFSVFGI